MTDDAAPAVPGHETPARGETALAAVGVAIIGCPIGSCPWTLTQPPPDPSSPGPVVHGATLDESIDLAAFSIWREYAIRVDSVIAAHLATHTMLEWATEVSRLQHELTQASLDPALAAYLDWPASFDENEIWCEQAGCTASGCSPESRGWICSSYSLTARGLLAGIATHTRSS